MLNRVLDIRSEYIEFIIDHDSYNRGKTNNPENCILLN